MFRRGSVRYYTFLVVFMVLFVAAVGILSLTEGKWSVTGDVVLDPAAMPTLQDERTIRQEIAAIAPKQTTYPTPAKRVQITPKEGVSPETIAAIVQPKHFFGQTITADITGAQEQQLQSLAVIEHVPVYKIAKTTASPRLPWGVQLMHGLNAGEVPAGGTGVIVAVLDTGVATHPDLKGRIKQCRDFTHGPTVQRNCNDQNGHGTHVAGTIVAIGKGIFGMAPQASLAVYAVCDSSGACFADDVAAAIDYATANKVNIISLSLGGREPSLLIEQAIVKAVSAGILVVAAAGNDGPGTDTMNYPAHYPFVVGVGAMDAQQRVTEFSSRGVNDGDGMIEDGELHFVAPGVSIESTWLNGGYYTLSGTSMATPHISGLAAAIWKGSAQETLVAMMALAGQHDIAAFGDDPAGGFGLPLIR